MSKSQIGGVKIKGVIFDYAGVVGTSPMKTVYNEIAKLAGMDYADVRERFHRFYDEVLKGQIPLPEFWQKYAELLNVDPIVLERTWIDMYTDHSKKNEEVIDIIMRLKKKGYKLALLSNAIKVFSEERKEWSHQMFDVTIISCDVNMRKPEKQIYDLTVQKLRLNPKECILIDDRMSNVEGAKAAGLEGILFKDATQLENDLKKLDVELEVHAND
jgi:epoxide hydrolase-like predicted phosphatase